MSSKEVFIVDATRTPIGKYGGSLKDAAEERGPLLPGTFFAITAGMVLAAAIIFIFVGKKFEHAQKEQAQAGLA